MISIECKTYWAGQIEAKLEILYVGADVYQFDKTIGGEWKFKRGSLADCLCWAETAERLLVQDGFERPLGYQGGSQHFAQ